MSSHFEALGFRVERSEDVELLAAMTLERGEVDGSPRPGWRSVRWELEGGPSLWAHESPRAAIECFSPALRADHAVRLFLSDWYDDAECEHCSGAVFEYRGETDDAEPLFPLAAHVPDIVLLRRGLAPGGSHLVRLGALAERIEVIPAGRDEVPIFLPSGLVGADGPPPRISPSVAVVASIVASELRRNGWSELPWWWVRLDACGLVFEAAVAADDAPHGFPAGGMIRGTLHLTAFLESPKGRERPSGWARLYREGEE